LAAKEIGKVREVKDFILAGLKLVKKFHFNWKIVEQMIPNTISLIRRTYSNSPCSFFGFTYVRRNSLNFFAMKRRTSSLVTHSLSVPWTRYMFISSSSSNSSCRKKNYGHLKAGQPSRTAEPEA